MIKEYSIKYWEHYYNSINDDVKKPSAFAEFCMPYIKGSILDVCCGNGRDSIYFHSNGVETSAFDINEIKDPQYEYKQFDLNTKSLNFSIGKVFDNVYIRFVLHAVKESIEDYILINANRVLKKGGLIFIEARSDKGAVPDNNHYRRLISIVKLKSKLINFEIIHEQESADLSITENENPVLIRIIARKMLDVKIKSDVSFNEFHKNAGTINKDSCSHLLLSTKSILDSNNIPFLLVFGTLLGAYRDGDFIGHDQDVDIMLFDFMKPEIDKLINQGSFALYGLEIIRNQNVLYSFRYKNDYIDIYFFKDMGDRYICSRLSIEKNQINDGVSEISFLGTKFNTVNNIEKYLIDKYGHDWKTPIVGKNAKS